MDQRITISLEVGYLQNQQYWILIASQFKN